jgi:hypothetical protein
LFDIGYFENFFLELNTLGGWGRFHSFYGTPLLPDKYGTNWRGWGRLS